MLAGKASDLNALSYPLYLSPKLDGIRAIVVEGVLVSRTLKPIPNLYTRKMFSKPEYEGFDGELIVGDPKAPDCFNVTTSAVMRETGAPAVAFHVFDKVGSLPFHRRHAQLSPLRHSLWTPLVEQRKVWSADEVLAGYAELVGAGYEGAMIRSLDGPYKLGRSTEKEGYLLKLKPFTDDEATIVGFEEQVANKNPAKTNLLGRTERSSNKENLVAANMLGALLVVNTAAQHFKVGTGFSEIERRELWAARDTLIGKTIKYRYQAEGMKDLPRFPSYGGFRAD
jgi:DNA ligase-1